MPLTPQQIADLKLPINVRGGKLGGALYAVSVAFVTFERVQILTSLGEVDVVWYYASSDGARVHLLTDQPEWFVELEGKILDAQRPR